MPGELGNEDMQQGVGYYEHRYPQHGEWMLDDYGLMPAMKKWRGCPHRKGMIGRVLARIRSIHGGADAGEGSERDKRPDTKFA